MSDKEDAERYRRLAILIEAGEWGVCRGNEDDYTDEYMDNKYMMDLRLDKSIKTAKEWEAAL